MNDTDLLPTSASATIVADAAASATAISAPSVPALRDTMLSGRFIGKRDYALEDTLSDFLLSDGGDAVERWFGSDIGRRLRVDIDALRGALDRDIAAIDALLSEQLDAILHEARLRRLEGTWRGIAWLVDGTDQSTRLKIKLFNAAWHEICRDL
jgi:type VI secretion system protein ImpD/type VI secretion system protein ImpC